MPVILSLEPFVSASPGQSSILSGISTALAQVLAADPQTVTADLCGCSQPAVSRRGDELHQWPASDLLRLALHRPPLADAIVRALRGRRLIGDPSVAVSAVLVENKAGHQVDAALMESLSDGRIDAAESRRIRSAIAERRRHEDEILLPALAEIEVLRA